MYVFIHVMDLWLALESYGKHQDVECSYDVELSQA